MAIEQVEKSSKSGQVTDGIESASEKPAEFGPRHPLRDGDGLSIDEEIDKGHTAIIHPPSDAAFSPEKRVKGVFDLDFALVAGIINHVLASVATTIIDRPILTV